MTNVPNVRSFSLNSREAYEALRRPDPEVWGPRNPKWLLAPDLEVIVEVSGALGTRQRSYEDGMDVRSASGNFSNARSRDSQR